MTEGCGLLPLMPTQQWLPIFTTLSCRASVAAFLEALRGSSNTGESGGVLQAAHHSLTELAQHPASKVKQCSRRVEHGTGPPDMQQQFGTHDERMDPLLSVYICCAPSMRAPDMLRLRLSEQYGWKPEVLLPLLPFEPADEPTSCQAVAGRPLRGRNRHRPVLSRPSKAAVVDRPMGRRQHQMLLREHAAELSCT